MGEFLKAEGFVEHLAGDYDIDMILQFFKNYKLTIDKFDYVGKCDGDCSDCGNNKFFMWREEILYDEDNQKFYMIEDTEIEFVKNTLDTLDFAIYICDKCGTWATYID